MNANKATFTFLGSIVCILFFSTKCTGQTQPSNSKEGKTFIADTIPPSNDVNDSIPFRFLPYNVQEKQRPSAPYHDYSNVRLTRSGGYYALREGAEEVIKEIYPGTLLYNRKSAEKGSTYWKIEFYDVQSKKIIQAVNLEESTPYNKERYTNIEFGLYGGQDAGHKAPPLPDSNCKFPKLPAPNNYLTTAYVSASPGGHVCVCYELYKLWNNLFVGFETTCVIYDKKGIELWRKEVLNSVASPYITSDGKYLSYIYGTHTTDNFFDSCQGHIEIVDLLTNRSIFHYVFEKNEKITTMFEAEKDGQLVVQSRDELGGGYVNKMVIVDFQLSGFFERSFTKEEWHDIAKNWKSYQQLKKQYSFNFKKLK